MIRVLTVTTLANVDEVDGGVDTGLTILRALRNVESGEGEREGGGLRRRRAEDGKDCRRTSDPAQGARPIATHLGR